MSLLTSFTLVILMAALCSMPGAAAAQHVRVFAVALANDSSGAFLGASSSGSGLYQSDDTGRTWRHLGWDNVKAFSMDVDRGSNGKILYMACGNGILHSSDGGQHWKLLTDWRMAEVMDVAVNQRDPNDILAATAHGPWRSRDGGHSWQACGDRLPTPYCSRVTFDSIDYRMVYLATEEGAFVHSGPWDAKHPWIRREGVRAPVRDIRQIASDQWLFASDPELTVSGNEFGRVVGTTKDYFLNPSGNSVAPPVLRSKHNIAACVQVGPIALVGSLDGGVYREDFRHLEAAPVAASFPTLQIWTLRTCFVTP